MTSRRTFGTLVGIGLLAGLLSAPTASAEPPARSAAPTRVIILVLDQTGPDTIERFKMRNVQALMRVGVTFPDAIVGHMAAETVVSHGVMTSGQLPKRLGWSDEVYRAVDGILGTAGAYH